MKKLKETTLRQFLEENPEIKPVIKIGAVVLILFTGKYFVDNSAELVRSFKNLGRAIKE